MKCTSHIHPYGPFPMNLPLEVFPTAGGRLGGTCRHCQRVRHLLSSRHQPGQPAAIWLVQACWRLYTERQTRRSQRAAARIACRHPQHQTGGRDSEAFYRTRVRYCKRCIRANTIQRYWRRRGQAIPWADALARADASRVRHAREKHAAAPPGHKWCVRHGGYWQPTTDRLLRGNPWWCPACATKVWQESNRRRRARAHAVAG